MAMELDTRVKTTMHVSTRLMAVMEGQAKKLGIPKNAFLTMGGCLLAVQLAPLLSGVRKREQMLDAVEQVFLDLLEKARSTVL